MITVSYAFNMILGAGTKPKRLFVAEFLVDFYVI